MGLGIYSSIYPNLKRRKGANNMGSIFIRTRTAKDGKQNKYWVIEYRIGDRLRRETVGRLGIVTKGIAKELLKKRELQVKLGQWNMITAKIPTLNEFISEYISYVRDTIGKRSWSRDKLSLRHLGNFFGESLLSAISPKDIQDYQNLRLREGVRPATVNRELACLKHLFNIARQRGKFFGDNPVSQVRFLEENNQIEKVLTVEEEQRLINSLSSHLIPIVQTALYTGMRKGEILSLRWENVDLENNVITVEATNSKSKKLKRIPISSGLRKILLEQRLKTGFSQYVFLTPRGKPYARQDSLKKSFERACIKAGIKGLRFHDLRHTAATRMVEAGANIVAIKKILGHADINTTMRYAHPEDSVREAIEKLSKFESITDQFTDHHKEENL
mgnify:CR=1 FL=1